MLLLTGSERSGSTVRAVALAVPLLIFSLVQRIAYHRAALTDRVFVGDGSRMSGRVIVRSPRLRGSDRVVATQHPNAIDGLRVEAGEAAAGIPVVGGSAVGVLAVNKLPAGE